MIRVLQMAVLLGLCSSAALANEAVTRCPNILISFDTSGSMRNNQVEGTSTPRYDAGREAVRALLAQNVPYRFGLQVFGDVTPNSGAVNSQPRGGTCGVSSPTCSNPTPDAGQNACNSVQAGGSRDAINTVLASLRDEPVDTNTPTYIAVDTAAIRPDMKDERRSRTMILVTDGEPTWCDDSITNNDGAAQTKTVNALQQLTASGVKTYVVGFALQQGSQTWQNLNAMAIAGGTARRASNECSQSNPCYYDANNRQQLEAALTTIVQTVGGEFGGTGCDDSCYAHPDDCGSGQICVGGSCVNDPCANVSCGSGSVCVAGQCQANCNQTCSNPNSECANGVCVAPVECSPACTGANRICVQGVCEENYCATGAITCPDGFSCIKNACQLAGPGNGNDGDDDGSNGNGCCSGAPGAGSILAIGLALASLVTMRSRRKA